MSRAASPQKPAGSSIERAYSRSYRSDMTMIPRWAGPRDVRGPAAGRLDGARLFRLFPDLGTVALIQHERADEERHQGDADRPPEAGQLVAGLGDEERADQRHRAAEPAVAEVIRQRERRIADLG